MLAFSTKMGHFQFTAVPFVIVIAPETFTRMMRELLNLLNNPAISNFMDEVSISTPIWKNPVSLITALFQRPSKRSLG